MDWQDIANYIFWTFSALLGLIMAGVKSAVSHVHRRLGDIDNNYKDMNGRVNEIQVLVAGKYVTREEFASMNVRLFDKLDSIEKQIQTKADK